MSMRRGNARRVGSAAPGGFPAQSGSVIARYDMSNVASVTAAANKASAVANLLGTASNATQGTAGLQPGYGLTTQNSLNTLDCTASKFMVATLPAGITNFTFQAVIKTGASLIGAFGIVGNATGGVVCQINNANLRAVDYAGGPTGMLFGDLNLNPNTAYVVTFRRSGTTYDAFLDALKTGSPGTATATALPTAWPIGNDDAAASVDPFTGLFGEILLYNTGLADADVLTNQAALKAKWGTG